MDPAPREFSDLPPDHDLGVPVPFACGTPVYGAPRDGNPPSVRHLDGRRVTQCALSRVCGVCGSALGRPIAFLGSADEADRNAFHFPPCHLECARAMLEAVAEVQVPVLGQVVARPAWVLTTTAAFEFVRPSRGDADPRPTFQPHEVLTETR